MTNELAKTQSDLPATQRPMTQEILNSDIVIPKLLLMQSVSEFVKQRKARDGDFVRNSTGEILGDSEKPIEVIPLLMTPEWMLKERVGAKYEYRRMEKRTAKNEFASEKFKVNGSDWERWKALTLYALLPADIAAYKAEIKKAKDSGKMPDINKTLMPVAISFRSSSFFKGGKDVVTFYGQVRSMQKENPDVQPYKFTLEIRCYLEKNDKGSFYVLKAGNAKPIEDPNIAEEARRWYTDLNALQDIQVNATGDAEEAEAAPTEY